MNFELTLSNLQDRGCRITNTRREIVKIFSGMSSPLSANQIEEKLFNNGVNVNKATIYRELQFLLDNGYLIEVYLRPNEVSYESSKQKHHYYLVCEVCGKVDSVTDCLVKKLKNDVFKEKGFKIIRHTLKFYGTCVDCVRKSNHEK